MDDDSSERQLRGFRPRWHDRGSSRSLGAPVSEHSLVGDDEIDRILEGCLDSTGENPQSEPERSPCESASDCIPPGPSASSSDTNRAVSIAFFSSVEWISLKFPWETGFMSQIFSDDPGPKASFTMPVSWTSVPEAVAQPHAEVKARAQDAVSDSTFAKHVKLTRNDLFWQQRDRTLKSAVDKWNFFLSLDTDASTVGRQIASDPHDADNIVTALLGTKSPNTSLKRKNALLSFHRWACVCDIDQVIPFDEGVGNISNTCMMQRSLLRGRPVSYRQ